MTKAIAIEDGCLVFFKLRQHTRTGKLSPSSPVYQLYVRETTIKDKKSGKKRKSIDLVNEEGGTRFEDVSFTDLWHKGQNHDHCKGTDEKSFVDADSGRQVTVDTGSPLNP